MDGTVAILYHNIRPLQHSVFNSMLHSTEDELVGLLSVSAVFDFDNVVSNAFRRITESAEEILENKVRYAVLW